MWHDVTALLFLTLSDRVDGSDVRVSDLYQRVWLLATSGFGCLRSELFFIVFHCTFCFSQCLCFQSNPAQAPIRPSLAYAHILLFSHEGTQARARQLRWHGLFQFWGHQPWSLWYFPTVRVVRFSPPPPSPRPIAMMCVQCCVPDLHCDCVRPVLRVRP